MKQESGAVGRETIPYKRMFTPFEMEEMRKEHTEKCLEIDTKEEALKLLNDERKPEIKDLKVAAKEVRKKLRCGFVEEQKSCLLVPNHVTGKMEYMDEETQEVLYERKLFPAEKQLRIDRTA